MTKRRHYPNAPIIEATISISVVPPVDLDAVGISKMREGLGEQYPDMVEEHFYASEVSVPEIGKPAEHDDIHEHVGYSFFSDDHKQRLRARFDSFDFSVMSPYDRWESFREEAYRLWDMYKVIAGVEKAVRVAVRYVNRIDIPNKILDSGQRGARLDDYLMVRPEIPDGWPTGDLLQNFFMQLQMWQPDLECMLIINEAPDIPPREGVVSMRLDIDLFKERYEEPWNILDDSEIWDFLERLHERKNDVFEASITDETRELIS